MPVERVKLVKLQTDDGHWVMKDEIPLGKTYLIDEVRIVDNYNVDLGAFSRRPMAHIVNTIEWLPVELLEAVK